VLRPIETARLSLRPFTSGDIDALHALWMDPNVRRYLWDDTVVPRALAAEVVERAVASAAASGPGMWSVMLRGLPLLIGFCGFRHIEQTPDIELLYGFYSEFWGQGFATEASFAALEYGFDTRLFERVHARTDTPNGASIRVLERLGMTLERETKIGELPTLCYSLDRSAFNQHHRARVAAY
jgi:ribosomal-protein-alanine N-acetyltransferase